MNETNDTVRVSNGGRGRVVRVYHTDPECAYRPDEDGHDISRANAKQRDLRECKYCAGVDKRGQVEGNDPGKYKGLVEQIQANDPDLPNP